MNRLLLLLPLCPLLFVSCDSGSSDSAIPTNIETIGNSDVDPRLQVYLNEFIIEADKRGVALNGNRLSNLKIEFGELEQGTLGICTSSGDENVVTISNTASPDQFRWVVLHELGHCLLRMEHRNNTLSIMNTRLSVGLLESQSEERLFDEFFQQQFFEAF